MAWQAESTQTHDLRWFENGRPTAWVRRQGGPAFRDPRMPVVAPPPYRHPTTGPAPGDGLDGAGMALAAGRTVGSAVVTASKLAVKGTSAYWRMISKIID